MPRIRVVMEYDLVDKRGVAGPLNGLPSLNQLMDLFVMNLYEAVVMAGFSISEETVSWEKLPVDDIIVKAEDVVDYQPRTEGSLIDGEGLRPLDQGGQDADLK